MNIAKRHSTKQGETSLGNSASSQRKRILSWLLSNPLTTLQARQHLDCMAPAQRILELKNMGHSIQTVWTNDLSPAGKVHRVAKYILSANGG
ncbi:MAG: helix-turn-helix domain-containing protein [Proteobacteria bacterium]|nr:helix-turn-helix domain-containing protein [Pseudomonadota bacterium]